jgi:protease-4
MGKLVNSELLKKLKLNPVSYLRGENAGIISSQEPFSDAQRDKVREGIEHVYEQFLERVAQSRKKTKEEVDAVGGGRVWTGEQALEHGLVDEIGNLRTAITRARHMANLPDTAPAQLVRGKGKPIGAQLADKSPAAIASYIADNIEQLTTRAQFIVPFDLKNK